MHLFKQKLKYFFLFVLLIGIAIGINSTTIQAVDESDEIVETESEEAPKEFLNERALTSVLDPGISFNDWQNDSVLNRSRINNPPKSTNTKDPNNNNRMIYNAGIDTTFSLAKFGDTHPYAYIYRHGIVAKNVKAVNYSQTTVSPASNFYIDRSWDINSRVNKNGYTNGTNKTAPASQLLNFENANFFGTTEAFFIYFNPNQIPPFNASLTNQPDIENIYFIFKTGNETAKLSSNMKYSTSSTKGFYGINDPNTAFFVGNVNLSNPQIVKAYYRDIAAPKKDLINMKKFGARISPDDGVSGYYNQPLSISKQNINNYTFLFNQKSILNSSDNTVDTSYSTDGFWNTSLNNTKRYMVFWYAKNISDAKITKKNSAQSAVKVGDAINYTVNVSSPSGKVVDPYIVDTIPAGMSEPTNVKLDNQSISKTPNSNGDYYTFNNNVLTVYFNQTTQAQMDAGAYNGLDGTGKTLTYTSSILSGNANETKKNVAELHGKNVPNPPKADSSVTIKQPEKLTGTLDKTNDQANPIPLNQIVTYTLKATNTAKETSMEKAYIEDTLPAELTEPGNIKLGTQALTKIVNANGNYYSWDATKNKLTIHMNGTKIQPGQSVTITYTNIPTRTGTLTNNAELFLADQTSLDKADSTIKVVETKGSVEKQNDRPDPVLAGTDVTYTLTPKNDSTELTLKKFTLEDTLPVGLDAPTAVKVGNTSLSNQFSNTTDYYSWDASNRKLIIHFNQTQLGPNQTTNVTYVAKVSKDATVGTKENTVVLKDINDNTLDTSSSTITVFESLNGLIKKNNNKEQGAIVNDLISYTLVATNTSSFTDLSKGYIYDILPSELGEPTNIRLNGVPLPKYDVNLTGQVKDAYTWLAADRKLIIHINGTDIKPQESITVTYDAKLLSGIPGNKVTNTATLYAATGTILSKDNSEVPVLEETLKGDLTKQNSKSSTGAVPGDVVDYTLIATNKTQSVSISKSFIYDDLPPGMDLPTNIQLNGVDLPASGNTTSDYYTFDQGNTRLTIHLNATTIKPGEKVTITYKSKLVTGTVNEIKTNKADWQDSKNQSIDKADSNFEVLLGGITGSIEKLNNKSDTGARINDVVSYTLKAKNTSPNADLVGSYIYDILPAELEQPTNIQLVLLDENGNEVAGSKKVLQLNSVVQNKDDAYSWVKADRKLIIHINGTTIKPNQAVKVTYDAKVLSGKENQAVLNTATFYADNPQKQLDKDTSTFKIKVVRINLKQEAIYPNFSNRNYRLVMPTTSYFTLDNIDLQTKTSFSRSTITASSYAENTNGAYRKMQLILASGAQGIIPSITIPEFYQYAGYQVTTTNVAHNSANRIQTGLPTLDYTNADEYWVTMYIKPDDWIKPTNEEVEPPMYNWDYATNKFN